MSCKCVIYILDVSCAGQVMHRAASTVWQNRAATSATALFWTNSPSCKLDKQNTCGLGRFYYGVSIAYLRNPPHMHRAVFHCMVP